MFALIINRRKEIIRRISIRILGGSYKIQYSDWLVHGKFYRLHYKLPGISKQFLKFVSIEHNQVL